MLSFKPKSSTLFRKFPSPAVGEGDFGGVEVPHPPGFSGGDPTGPVVVWHCRLRAAVALVVEVDVLLWRVPGLVGVEAVYHQEERLRLARDLQVVHGPGKHLRGEPIFFFFAVGRVGEVLADFGPHAGVVAVYRVAVHDFFGNLEG